MKSAIGVRKELWLLLIVVALAGFFRFYHITSLPPGLYPDEAVNGNDAATALRTGEFKVFYPTNNGREGLFINLQTISIKFFGHTAWALRLVSAIIGTLTVIGLYLLAKELFAPNPNVKIQMSNQIQNPSGQRTRFGTLDLKFGISRGEFVALLSSFFLATSFWHINFSRIGFRAILVPFFLSFDIYWLLKALRTGKISSTLLGGVATGLGFYSYIAFRFAPFVMAVPILYAFWSWRRGRKTQPCVPCAVGLFILVTFVTALPIGLYFLNHPQDFFGRSQEISIFSAPSPTLAFVKSTGLTLIMFNVFGDCNGRQNLPCRPELYWPVGIFFLIGLGLAIRNIWKKPFSENAAEFTLLGWMIFMMLPATLTREGLPHALRSIGLIAPAMIFAGWGAWWLFERIESYFDRYLKNPRWQPWTHQLSRIKREVLMLFIAILALTTVHAFQTYFYVFSELPGTYESFRQDLTDFSNYLKDRSPLYNTYVLANYPNLQYGLPIETEVIRYLTDTNTATNQDAKRIHYLMPDDLSHVMLPKTPGEKTLILPLNQRDAETFKILLKRFPKMKLEIAGKFLILEN